MHIQDGILPAPILCAAGCAAATGVVYGMKRLTNEDVPKTASLTSFFFVASLIHLPMPPASVHLILPGLLGLLLGWAAFPAVFIGLVMQYTFFGHGGITTLGVNTCTMAIPAITCHYLFSRLVRRSKRRAVVFGFMGGALGVLISALIYSGMLFLCGDGFAPLALASLAFHAPVVVIEGLITASTVSFLFQVRPESLRGPTLRDLESLEPAS